MQWGSRDVKQKKKKKHHCAATPSTNICKDICDQSLYTSSDVASSFSLCNHVLPIRKKKKKKTGWELVKMDVRDFRLKASRIELHCKVIIPSCHLIKVCFRKRAGGSLSKMSNSCFDNLGWTLMATQIEQVWKCHISGHYASIICFISHRASRPQTFFPVKFNPCLTHMATMWQLGKNK